VNSSVMSYKPREPAARGLPVEENWRPRTWAHFRYLVLRQLHKQGAHTIAQLAGNPPETLGLPLNRRELTAVLESARRRRLITRLDPDTGTGPITPADEWVLTGQGRSAIRGAAPWLFGQAGRLRVLAPLLTIAGGLGAWKVLAEWAGQGGGTTILALVIGAIFALEFILLGGMTLRSRSTGEDAHSFVAKDWKRWEREKPELHRIASEGFPWIPLALILALAMLLIVLGARMSPHPPPLSHDQSPLLFLFRSWPAGLGVLLFAGVFVYVSTGWTSRWDQIAQIRKAELDDLAAGDAQS